MPLNKNLKWLLKDERARNLEDMLPIFYAQLPKGVEFDSDTWDLLAWVPRRGNKRTANISFRKYKNSELKMLVKIYILVNQHAKLTRESGKSTLKSYHPDSVQSSGFFAGVTLGVIDGIYSRNQTASFCERREHQLNCAQS